MPWVGKEGKVVVRYNTYLAYTLVMELTRALFERLSDLIARTQV